MSQTWRSSGVGQYVASERHMFWTPKHYQADGTKRGVLYCPAKAQTASDVLGDFIAAAIVDAGFPLASFDIGNPTGATPQWGNDTTVTRVGQAKTYMESALGVKTGGVLGYGGSMGGLSLLNRARQNASDFVALALAIPIGNLDYVHDNDVQANAAGIETAYVNLAGWNAAVATHDPVQFAASLSGLPMKLWHADDDIFTPLASYQSFAAANGAVLRSGGNVNHTTSWIDPAEVVAYLVAHA